MNREAKIGLFVMIALGVVTFFIIRTSDLSKLFRGAVANRTIAVKISDASGIRAGTPVRVAGVRVGEVKSLELKGDHALGQITLPKDLELKSGARVEVKTQGVLGEQYLALYPGDGAPLSAAILAGESPLEASVPPGLEDLTTKIAAITDELLLITRNVRLSTATADGGNRMEIIAANIERLTQILADMAAENRTNLNRTTSEFAQLSESMSQGIPKLIEELTGVAQELRAITASNKGRFGETMEHVTALSSHMEKASESLSGIAKKVDTGEGSIGKLVNETETVDNINKVLVTANESLGEVKKFLSKANDIEVNLHLRGEYLFDSQGTKTYFGMQFKPSADKYYLLEGVSRDSKLLSTGFRERESFTYDADGNLLTRTVFREEDNEDELAITGQLAYRVGPVFLRGGIIEGEGGGGLDFSALQDRLKISFESYDFSRRDDLNPHAKIDLSFKIGHGIQLNFGWDDLFESGRQSAFLGAGISWKDDDLKVLLTSASRAF